MDQKVFIGLGSNLGDKANNLFAARAALNRAGVGFRTSSHFYETVPWGDPNQPPYLNWVAEIFLSDLQAAPEAVSDVWNPHALVGLFKAIEARMGRPVSGEKKWSARIIDIDLLVFGDRVLNDSIVKVPHPLASQRAFVLAPWAEIAPNFVLPGTACTVEVLFEALAEDERAGVRACNDPVLHADFLPARQTLPVY